MIKSRNMQHLHELHSKADVHRQEGARKATPGESVPLSVGFGVRRADHAEPHDLLQGLRQPGSGPHQEPQELADPGLPTHLLSSKERRESLSRLCHREAEYSYHEDAVMMALLALVAEKGIQWRGRLAIPIQRNDAK